MNINLAAFSAYVAPKQAVGMNFVVFLMVVAAAEFGLALAIIISLNRNDRHRRHRQLRELRG